VLAQCRITGTQAQRTEARDRVLAHWCTVVESLARRLGIQWQVTVCWLTVESPARRLAVQRHVTMCWLSVESPAHRPSVQRHATVCWLTGVQWHVTVLAQCRITGTQAPRIAARDRVLAHWCTVASDCVLAQCRITGTQAQRTEACDRVLAHWCTVARDCVLAQCRITGTQAQ